LQLKQAYFNEPDKTKTSATGVPNGLPGCTLRRHGKIRRHLFCSRPQSPDNRSDWVKNKELNQALPPFLLSEQECNIILPASAVQDNKNYGRPVFFQKIYDQKNPMRAPAAQNCRAASKFAVSVQ